MVASHSDFALNKLEGGVPIASIIELRLDHVSARLTRTANSNFETAVLASRYASFLLRFKSSSSTDVW